MVGVLIVLAKVPFLMRVRLVLRLLLLCLNNYKIMVLALFLKIVLRNAAIRFYHMCARVAGRGAHMSQKKGAGDIPAPFFMF